MRMPAIRLRLQPLKAGPVAFYLTGQPEVGASKAAGVATRMVGGGPGLEPATSSEVGNSPGAAAAAATIFKWLLSPWYLFPFQRIRRSV
jgi:hypothetical protein